MPIKTDFSSLIVNNYHLATYYCSLSGLLLVQSVLVKIELKMSESVTDLTQTGSPSGKSDKPASAAKKLKQLRLPFAPIQKNADKAEPVKTEDKLGKPDEDVDAGGKKRKHSEETEEPNKKPALEEQGELTF